jgi:hypothetical protein
MRKPVIDRKGRIQQKATQETNCPRLHTSKIRHLLLADPAPELKGKGVLLANDALERQE